MEFMTMDNFCVGTPCFTSHIDPCMDQSLPATAYVYLETVACFLNSPTISSSFPLYMKLSLFMTYIPQTFIHRHLFLIYTWCPAVYNLCSTTDFFSSYIHGFLLLPAIFQHNTHSTTYKKNSPPSPFSLFYPDLPILLATMYISRIYKANSGHWAEMDRIAISCLWKLSQANCLQVWVLARKARVIRSV